jgi:hypothetical protein
VLSRSTTNSISTRSPPSSARQSTRRAARSARRGLLREPPRPAIVSEAHLECLDAALNEFGERPMLGALLQLKFGLTRAEALQVLGFWMQSYAGRHGRTPQ